eukprot:scaffold67777_cov19-Tisochrysis_lutea.AAC.2
MQNKSRSKALGSPQALAVQLLVMRCLDLKHWPVRRVRVCVRVCVHMRSIRTVLVHQLINLSQSHPVPPLTPGSIPAQHLMQIATALSEASIPHGIHFRQGASQL